jgi:hypothetical protein
MPITFVKGKRAATWMTLKLYCAKTGDTRNAVHARRKKGVWQDGVQCRLSPDKKLWINMEEVNNWVESTSKKVP